MSMDNESELESIAPEPRNLFGCRMCPMIFTKIKYAVKLIDSHIRRTANSFSIDYALPVLSKLLKRDQKIHDTFASQVDDGKKNCFKGAQMQIPPAVGPKYFAH